MKIPPILLLLLLISQAQSLSPLPSPKPSPESPSPATAPPSLPPSPAISGPDCTTDLLNLTSCLTFVQKDSNLTLPEKGCCSAFAGLVNSNPICLCQLLASSDTFGIKIDEAKALTLPTICHVQTPPISLCSVLGIPVPGPGAFSPESSAAGEPLGSVPLSPAATSVAAAPSGAGDGNTKVKIASLQFAISAIIVQMFVILF